MRYLYRTVSGKIIEVEKRITDPHPTRDPETGEEIERRVWSTNPILFKGSGFYTLEKRLYDDE